MNWILLEENQALQCRGEEEVIPQGQPYIEKVFISSKEPGISPLGPNWDGPYHVSDNLRPETFKFETLYGKVQPHPWNVEHLRMYYQ